MFSFFADGKFVKLNVDTGFPDTDKILEKEICRAIQCAS